ncbi:hypothetical protein [Reichenbachiella sp.]|uniref:hypothetical protein n=1 Tax=Reichenbachiella sp. TaxID=2184521 RepID=UPI003BB05DF4
MNLNTIVKKDHLVQLKEEFDYLSDINYDLNWGARWKWASILHAVKSLKLLDKPFTYIDIGGGLSPIHFILSKYGTAINVDLAGFAHTWYPVNSKGFYVKSDGIECDMNNIHYLDTDFLKYIKEIPDNTIDFVLDGCSFIHFNPEKSFSHNDGVTLGMKEIERVLKPGGHFISSSDVVHPDYQENLDMIYPQHLGECFSSSGLEYVSEPDWELEPFYLDKNNLHIRANDNSVPGYLEQTRLGCTCCKELPDYHFFCHGPQRETVISVCLFTLRKKTQKSSVKTEDTDYGLPSKKKQNRIQMKWSLLRRIIRVSRYRELRKIIRPIIIKVIKTIGLYSFLRKMLRPNNRPMSGG